MPLYNPPATPIYMRDTPANFTVTDAMTSEANAGVAATIEVSGGRRALLPLLARCNLDVSGLRVATVRWRFTRLDGTTFLGLTHNNAVAGTDEVVEFGHGTAPSAAGTSAPWDEEIAANDGVGIKKMELLVWKDAAGGVSVTLMRMAWFEL